MYKILILTASTGEGHNQAAESLAKKFTSEGYEVIKYDFINDSSKFLKTCIVDGYELLACKLPLIYGKLYKLTDVKKLNRKLTYPFASVKNRTLNFINENKPDLIIGTHPLSVNVISLLKKRHNINIPFISIITDFKAHYAYIDDYVDAYITASEYTKEKLSLNIPSNKIYTYGIPIREEFLVKSPNILNTNSHTFNVLVMGGSMGLKSILKVMEELMLNPNKLNITAVCGKNKELKASLDNKFHSTTDKNITILGFTKDVAKLMNNSHVIITKPGGLTTSESIAKTLPMIIPFAIPGQEEENADFLQSCGAAIYLKDIKSINKELNKLINNPKLLCAMKKNLYDLSKNYSIDNIVCLTKNLICKYSGE